MSLKEECTISELTSLISLKSLFKFYHRFMYARNWDDFLQRDLKAMTFPRALGMFVISSMAFYTCTINNKFSTLLVFEIVAIRQIWN